MPTGRTRCGSPTMPRMTQSPLGHPTARKSPSRATGTDLVELTSGADPAWRYPTAPTGISCLFDECPPQFYCGQNGVCVTFCGDGYWNGDEGDVDCGGSCTPRCQSGQHCWVQSDCASGICVGGVCQ